LANIDLFQYSVEDTFHRKLSPLPCTHLIWNGKTVF